MRRTSSPLVARDLYRITMPPWPPSIVKSIAHVKQGRPIAWVCHFNKPHETPAFARGTWGANFSPGLGPQTGFGTEALFEKEVFGAFTGTVIEEWLRLNGVESVLLRRLLCTHVSLDVCS